MMKVAVVEVLILFWHYLFDTEQSYVNGILNHFFGGVNPNTFTGKHGSESELDAKFITKRVVIIQMKQ